jgi:hypothetical protein
MLVLALRLENCNSISRVVMPVLDHAAVNCQWFGFHCLGMLVVYRLNLALQPSQVLNRVLRKFAVSAFSE